VRVAKRPDKPVRLFVELASVAGATRVTCRRETTLRPRPSYIGAPSDTNCAASVASWRQTDEQGWAA
jgi:hypothetical protein